MMRPHGFVSQQSNMVGMVQILKGLPQRKAFFGCLAITVCMKITTLFFNGVLNMAQSPIDDSSRDWVTLVQAIAMVVLALVARRAPRFIVLRPLTLIALIATLAGACLAPLGVHLRSIPLLLLGTGLTGAAVAWASVLWLVLCSSLSFRWLVACFAAGGLIAIPLAIILSYGGYLFVVACYAACVIATLVFCTQHTRLRFAECANAEAAVDAEVTRPRSVLPLTHDLFIYIFVFSLAYGFGLRYEYADGGLLGSWFMGAILLGIVAYSLGHRAGPRADTLFNVAFALILAGFLLVLLDHRGFAAAASQALASSNTVFGLLMTSALCTIAGRSRSNALPALGWGYAAYYAGIGAGAQVGMFVTEVAGVYSLTSRSIVAMLLAAIMLYTLLSIRDFGFDKTIATVEIDQPAAVIVEVQYEDRVEARCQELALAHGLTEREADVLGLLARGNNTLRIQEALSITKNTLKYHTRHVYEKLGVHSQQELIDRL